MTKKLIENGWFRESEALWPGQALHLKVKAELTHFQSKYQDILVFDSESYDRVLVLDGVIQLTEKDEPGYQEMIAQVPLFASEYVENVLIIGGGDGGVLREVCKHKRVKSITMCEIDKDVIETSKKFFKDSMATSYGDSRLNIVYKDGAEFLDQCKDSGKRFDLIIVDSSDPVGPAETLYTKEFYSKMHSVLSENGLLCMQGENMFLHLDLISDLINFCKNLFPSVAYFNTLVPTYPSGSIGFVICSKLKEHALDTVCISAQKEYERMESSNAFKYYSSEVHQAAFVLPKFVTERLSLK